LRFDTGDSHDTAKFYVSVLENDASSKKWRNLEHECTGRHAINFWYEPPVVEFFGRQFEDWPPSWTKR
jgi:hypothetical protein